MKKLLFVLALWGGGSCAWAVATPSLVYQVGVSSITTVTISVSSSPVAGATQMDNPQLLGRVVVEIDNTDAAANLWCVPSSSAPLTANSGIGRKIPPGSSWVVSIVDRVANPGLFAGATAVKFWCLSDTTSATSKAAVTQMY